MSTSLTSLDVREKLSCLSCKIAALRLFFHLEEELSHDEISGIDFLFEDLRHDFERLESQLSQL